MLEVIIEKLKAKSPFTFTRWGDGEWSAILNRQGANCDGHEYFPDMCAALRDVLKDHPPYYLGMQNHAMRNMGEEIETFLKVHGLQFDWVNADVFHHASIKDQFTPVLDALFGRPVILVGPKVLREFNIYTRFIEVPEKNCWLDHKNIGRLVSIALHNTPGAVVIFCAGMPSNVIIHNLYKQHGSGFTLIDMGSVLMPYVSVANRSYHKAIVERLSVKN